MPPCLNPEIFVPSPNCHPVPILLARLSQGRLLISNYRMKFQVPKGTLKDKLAWPLGKPAWWEERRSTLSGGRWGNVVQGVHVSRWVAGSFCLDVLECSLWMFMVEAMACQCWSFGRGFEPIWFSSIHSMLLNSIIGAILRYWRSMWCALMNQTLMVSNVFDSTARVSVGSVSCLFETHHQYS